MSKIISVHSFRGGTGKSNITANISTILAQQGHTVGVVDTDIQSPGIHVLFGMTEEDMRYSLNDYLWGKCNIEDTAHTVSLSAQLDGTIHLVPSSIKPGEIARVLREGYDVGLLNDGFNDLLDELSLDYLMIDTHPGLNEETLLSIAMSDALAIIMRPDSQDYQGTSVTVEVARKLDVARMLMVVNKTPSVYDQDEIRKRVEATYNCQVGAVIPHSDNMMTLASSGVFCLEFPNDPVTALLNQIAAALIA